MVGKPGAVSHPVAADLIAAAQLEAGPQFLGRGRTYARAGQVMALSMGDGEITAEIQGTEAKPYRVRLFRTRISGADRVGAGCTCPYGCDDGWCKHATALAYVAAALLDRVWLRGTTSLLAAMGLALTAVAVATYLLAVSSDTAAWAALGVAGVITVAMPAILVTFQRQLGEAAERV